MSYFKYFAPKPAILDSLFTRNELQFQHYKAFNDPFESRPIFQDSPEDREYAASSATRAGQKVVAKLRQRFPNVPQELLEKEIAKSAREFSQISSLSVDLPEWLNKAFVALCLTKNPDDILMWSHYAVGHTGFVIEFNDSEPLFTSGEPKVAGKIWTSDLGIPLTVDYSPNRPTVPLNKMGVKPLFCVKSDHWKYEAEIRVIRPMDDGKKHDVCPHYFKFNPESVLSVTFGECVTNEFLSDAVKSIRKRKKEFTALKFYRAKLSKTNFQIERVPISP